MLKYKISFLLSAVDCGALGTLTNGIISVSTTTYLSTATYTCTTTGYGLMGAMTRTCQATGDWSPASPTCAGMLAH